MALSHIAVRPAADEAITHSSTLVAPDITPRRPSFTLRTAFSVTEWDDRYIAIVRKMAEIINLQIGTGKAIEEDKAWKESAMGF